MVLQYFHNDPEKQVIVVQEFPNWENRLGLVTCVVKWKNIFQFDLTSLHVPAYELESHLDTILQVDRLMFGRGEKIRYRLPKTHEWLIYKALVS